MKSIVNSIKVWFERQAFGICEWWGEKLGIQSSGIRMFFIYASFLTIGSPIIVYMAMGFVMNLRNMMRSRQRGSIWDL
jgi:phage shock protein PspC (stress-responsive transcriptional regulator)